MRFKYQKQIESHLMPDDCCSRIVEAGQPETRFAILRLGFPKLPQDKSYFVRNTPSGLYVYGQGADSRSWVRVDIAKHAQGSRIVLSPASQFVWLIVGLFSFASFGFAGVALLMTFLISSLPRDGIIFWLLSLLVSMGLGIGAFAGYRHDCSYVDWTAEMVGRRLKAE